MDSKKGTKKQIKGRLLNGLCLILSCVAAFFAASCKNVIHELIPPADSNIYSFALENAERTRYRAATTGGVEIIINVPANTDVTSLLPIVESGDKSTVLPITLSYIHRAFPSADLMSLAVQMNASQKAGDLGNWMLNFIRENKDFTVPPIDEPVDFTQPVMFCVIAGRGNYKLYTITVVPEKIESPSSPDEPYIPPTPSAPDIPDVPPVYESEKRILSFVVNEPKQTKPSVIIDGARDEAGFVKFTLDAGVDVCTLYPLIAVSEGAGILPLTQEYLLSYLSYTELIAFYAGYSTAIDLNNYASSYIKKLDADKFAQIMKSELTLPIDFTSSVPFVVIGPDKTAKIYLASCEFDENTAALVAFAVAKTRNPGLMGDADVSVSGNAVSVVVTYPTEYPNFKLIPDVVIEGDSWEITGGTLRVETVGTSSEESECVSELKTPVYLVPPDAYPIGKEYTAALTVRRGDAEAKYTITLAYKEDPDTIRSITDFRFLKTRNPAIRTTAMASISKNEDSGFISVAVLYEDEEPPYELIADFYSPGTCSVEHVEQISGKTKNNFQYDMQILCTSKNKLFCRLYTVRVSFIKAKTAEAVLNYFAFPKHLNPGLSQSVTGLIDESSGTIFVSAKYHTPEKPARLVPEFAATGNVSVNSILQSSGYSAQDFSHSVYYSVRAQNDWSSDSRTYRVSVNWERDEQSACAITEFGFNWKDNRSLKNNVSARINEFSGAIYAFLPKDAGKSALVPYFSAQGSVTVDGLEQTSGGSRQDFSNEVVYTVTSANGLYSKQYIVSVQEAGPVIYVNSAAIGRNNGSCWQDAYITLDAAFEQAETYRDAPKEIWIAHGNGQAYVPLSDKYRVNGFRLVSNTAIRGGFDGTETSADDRRSKVREISFDVNAKNKITQVRHNSNVVATQTKIQFAPTSYALFSSDRRSIGEITFDGIDFESVPDSNNQYFFAPRGYEFSGAITIKSCEIVVPKFSYYLSGYRVKELNVIDSDVDCVIYADNLDAKGSRFGLQLSSDSLGDNANFTRCEFFLSKQFNYHYNIYIECPIPFFKSGVVNECRFMWDDMWNDLKKPLRSKGAVKYENCLLESIPFGVSSVKNCEIGTDIKTTVYSSESFTAEGTRFRNAQLYNCYNVDIKNCDFSNSLSDVDSFIHFPSGGNYFLETAELENVSLKGYSFFLDNGRSYKNVRMKDCLVQNDKKLETKRADRNGKYYNYYDYNDKENTFFVTTNEGAVLEILGSKFEMQSQILTHEGGPNGNVSITKSTFVSPRSCVYSNSPAVFTDNDVTAKAPSGESEYHIYTVPAVIFTNEKNDVSRNAFSGRLTQIKTSGRIEGNKYDGFVLYDITGTPQGFTNEKIEITQEPLYCKYGSKCEKKAYLIFTDGTLTRFPFAAQDFSNIYIKNSDCVLSGENFGMERHFLSCPLYFKMNDDDFNWDLSGVDIKIPFNRWPTTEDDYYFIRGENNGHLRLYNCSVTGLSIDSAFNYVDFEKCSSVAEIDFSCTFRFKENSVITVNNSNIGNARIFGKDITVTNSTVGSCFDGKSGENIYYRGSVSIENSTVNLVDAADVTINASSGKRTKITGDVSGSTVFVANTDFSPIDSSYTSTALTGYEKITVKNSTFSGYTNKYRGSAIYAAAECNLTVSDSTFSGNTNSAIYAATECNLTVSDSTFSGNTGSAIYAGTKCDLTVSDSTFLGNTAEKTGGAICVNDKYSTLTITRSTFFDNVIETWRGGAIYFDGKNISISDCEFTNNKSLESDEKRAGGGAIAISCNMDDVTATISGCTFKNNSSLNGIDVFMCAEWESGKKYSGCKLNVSDNTSNYYFFNTVFTKNITRTGSL